MTPVMVTMAQFLRFGSVNNCLVDALAAMDCGLQGYDSVDSAGYNSGRQMSASICAP